jgi:hypothetical protein
MANPLYPTGDNLGSTPFEVPRELFPVRHRFLELHGARIHYVDEGTGDTLLVPARQSVVELSLSQDHRRVKGRLPLVSALT